MPRLEVIGFLTYMANWQKMVFRRFSEKDTVFQILEMHPMHVIVFWLAARYYPRLYWRAACNAS